jgi:hypothetical protein
VSTAEKAAANLHTMTDHSAFAMLTTGRDSLNGAFETVERVPRSGGD